MNDGLGYPVEPGKNYTVSGLGVKGVIFLDESGKELSRQMVKKGKLTAIAPINSKWLQLLAGRNTK